MYKKMSSAKKSCIHVSDMAHGMVVEGAVTLHILPKAATAAGVAGIDGEVPVRHPDLRRDQAKSAHCKKLQTHIFQELNSMQDQESWDQKSF